MENTESTLEKVIEILAEELGWFAQDITAQSTFAELDADSLDKIDIQMELEDEFEIVINNANMMGCKAVQDVVAMVETELRKK